MQGSFRRNVWVLCRRFRAGDLLSMLRDKGLSMFTDNLTRSDADVRIVEGMPVVSCL